MAGLERGSSWWWSDSFHSQWTHESWRQASLRPWCATDSPSLKEHQHWHGRKHSDEFQRGRVGNQTQPPRSWPWPSHTHPKVYSAALLGLWQIRLIIKRNHHLRINWIKANTSPGTVPATRKSEQACHDTSLCLRFLIHSLSCPFFCIQYHLLP